MKHRVGAILGSTAVGKSSIALEAAERLNAEIVSVDSMQVYRDMDVGTDKATADMRARVPHHLLDIRDPVDDVTVAEFQALARAAVDDIAMRGKVPLLVGGSGLYFRAVVDDLDFPPTVPEVRSRLEEEAETLGATVLYERLADIDPRAAERIQRSNVRRIVRALEMIEVTGRLFSENDRWEVFESIYDLKVVGLQRDREELDARIARRVAQMFERGIVEEARALAERGMGRTARMALGYRQILDAPDASQTQWEAEIVRATKRFARRQESWFRADPRVTWLDAADPGVADRASVVISGPSRG